jgi:cysteinyl-tRNA synthetase
LFVLGLENLVEVEEVEPPAEVIALAAERDSARATRDFGAADRLRDQIHKRGWEVRDSPGGPELLPRQ